MWRSFKYKGNQFRAISDKGEPLFVAKDVCQILGLLNTTKAVTALDRDEKFTLTLSSGARKNALPTNVITEPGLYKLILRSDKPEGNRVRVIKDEQGEPWFVAKDVCDVLGLEAKHATARLDADEKSKVARTDLALLPGQQMWVINESGLYKLVLRSDKPEAKPFQRWVTHDVLPAVRKTGGYIMGAKDGYPSPRR